GPGGQKLTDEEEALIEEGLALTLPLGDLPELPRADALSDYIACATRLMPANALQGWRVVLDTANGATTVSSPHVLRALGAEVIALGHSPDGNNINDGVGSEHPKTMAARVLEAG